MNQLVLTMTTTGLRAKFGTRSIGHDDRRAELKLDPVGMRQARDWLLSDTRAERSEPRHPAPKQDLHIAASAVFLDKSRDLSDD